MRPLFQGAAWAALLLAAGACDRMQPIVELWSDRAELAAYVETFNAAGGPVKVELTYVAQPAQELLRSGRGSRSGVRVLAFESRAAAPAGAHGPESARPGGGRLVFFQGWRQRDRADGRRVTLPFAFNLPVVVFARAAAPPGIDQFVLTAEELRRLGEEYVTATPERVTHVGFSPLWDVDLVYYLAQSFGAGFAATADGHVNIDAAAVAKAVAAARDWIRNSHGGIASDRGVHRHLLSSAAVSTGAGRAGCACI